MLGQIGGVGLLFIALSILLIQERATKLNYCGEPQANRK
jgi:hypothetical protein